MQQHGKRHSGFTLLELLVVIAIIALLAAILFPVFAQARDKARTAACQSNMRQIALGIHQYTQDYDEKYPLFTDGDASNNYVSTTGTYWDDKIFPYVKSLQIFHCPSDKTTVANGFTMSYGINGTTNDGYGTFLGITGFKKVGANYPLVSATLSEVASPTTTILVGELFSGWRAGGTDHEPVGIYGMSYRRFQGSGSAQLSVSYPLATRQYVETPVHGGQSGLNLAFCDGHVKFMRPAQTLTSGGGPVNRTDGWAVTGYGMWDRYQ